MGFTCVRRIPEQYMAACATTPWLVLRAPPPFSLATISIHSPIATPTAGLRTYTCTYMYIVNYIVCKTEGSGSACAMTTSTRPGWPRVLPRHPGDPLSHVADLSRPDLPTTALGLQR